MDGLGRCQSGSVGTSNDSRSEERTLIDPEIRALHAGLLPHEYVHSWNGKYRRPADLTTSDYEQTMQDDLLWVYEGLTDYLGDVLTARSGLWTPEQYREELLRGKLLRRISLD